MPKTNLWLSKYFNIQNKEAKDKIEENHTAEHFTYSSNFLIFFREKNKFKGAFKIISIFFCKAERKLITKT